MCTFTAHYAFGENNFARRSVRQQINEDIFQLTDVQKAIARLCRALQINPKNRTARQNFAEIARHPILTARQRSQVYLLEDLLTFNKDLKRRADYLAIKRDFLKDQFIKDELDSQAYLRGLRDIEGNLSRVYEARMYYDHSLFDQSDPLILVYKILNDQKDQLLVRVEYLKEQYRWLTMIRNDQQRYVVSPQFDRFSNIVVPVASNTIINIVPEFSQEATNEMIFDSSEIITLAPVEEKNYLDSQRKLDFPQTQFNELREDLKQKDRKINDLSKQVVDLSLKMSEIEILFNKKIESTLHLKADLNDAHQRFLLGKRIIQEKNEEIQSLQIVLDQMKARSTGSNNVFFSRDEKLVELNGILEIYKYKLIEKNRLAKEKTRALAKTQDDLRSLGDRLIMLEVELSEIKKRSQQDEFKSPEIESKVLELQSKFENIQHFLLENLVDSDKMKSRGRFESSDLSN